jgi:lactate permease
MTGTPLETSALVFSQFMPVISTMIGFGMLYIVGGWTKIREGFVPCLLAGLTMGITAIGVAHVGRGIVLTGVIGGIATIVMMLLFLKLKNDNIIERDGLVAEVIMIEQSISWRKALGTWLILITACWFITYGPRFTITVQRMAMHCRLFRAAVI